jgi:hypothetical protein
VWRWRCAPACTCTQGCRKLRGPCRNLLLLLLLQRRRWLLLLLLGIPCSTFLQACRFCCLLLQVLLLLKCLLSQP